MHPGVVALLRFFEYSHLPEHLQGVSRPCGDLAKMMVEECGENAELTLGYGSS